MAQWTDRCGYIWERFGARAFYQFYSFGSIEISQIYVPRISMATSLVNTGSPREREGKTEAEKAREREGVRKIEEERERKRESGRDGARQIRYTGIAAATRAARGVRPFIGGWPAPLYPPLPPDTPARFSLSLLRSPPDPARPLTALLHLIGPRVLTRDVLDTFNDIHAQPSRPVLPRRGGR